MDAAPPTSRSVTVALFVALLLITGLLFSTSFRAAGAGMDEGTLVTYPDLVLDGQVPGRDFETFYGPGGPYLLAGAFEVFGHQVWVERSVGLAYRLLIVAAIFLLLLPWGRIAAGAGGLLSMAVMLPLGVAATAWFGGLALGLLGLAWLAWLVRSDQGGGSWALAGAGALSALAIAFRPDLAPAVLLSALPLWLALPRQGRLRHLAGFLVGLVPTIVWLAVVGPHGLKKLVDHLRTQQADRTLPLPSPASTAWGQVLVASVLALLAAFGTSAWLRRRASWSFEGRLMLSLSLFSLATLPAALERADDAHVLAYGCVAIALVPAVVATLWPLLRRADPAHRGLRAAMVAGLAVLVVLAVGATIHTLGVGPTVRTNVLGIYEPESEAFTVSNEGREFPIGSATTAAGLDRLLPRLDALARPGDTVFVGPRDLSRTAYADTFLYHLLPDLRPATYYDELNPEVPAGLADELRGADFLLLTSQYEGEEAEDGTTIAEGSDAPNRVVEGDFCAVTGAGGYRLYRRCG